MRYLSIICLVWFMVAVSTVSANHHKPDGYNHHYGGDSHHGHDETGDYCEHCYDNQKDYNHHRHSHHGDPDVYIPPYDPPPVIIATTTTSA
ncbi:hypothetical protein K492DRAFT_175334 [Lichtheimia hyalospora FSU 10163]|nr:hypothetical protein K492DRAFT_175334 [Lichtheimia hyalospora FSU 10163]